MSGEAPDAEHQIVLRVARNQKLTVSCRCQAVYGRHDRRRGDYHEPMYWPEGMTSFEVYNIPENHNGNFTDKDKIKL